MITRNTVNYQSENWQQALATAITDPRELLSILELDLGLIAKAEAAVQQFRLRVPRRFVALMRKGDPNDPLLRQVLPIATETNPQPDGYMSDPLQEAQFNPVPGLLHKFYGRVLLTLSGACAINCRYCFRRHFPYEDNVPGRQGWQPALDYIAKQPSIREVILSGGDPLICKDQQLQQLISQLAAITHVRYLRFHSRLPIVLPERITLELTTILKNSQLICVMVTHCNHANELDKEVVRAVARLKNANVTVLNQAVLLQGVNDNVADLVNLSQSLFESGILPYYLYQLDKVKGAAHFEVTDDYTKKLLAEVAAKLPDYLVPRLVREVPGSSAKQAVNW